MPRVGLSIFCNPESSYNIPAGSRIVMSVSQLRVGQGGACEYRANTMKKNLCLLIHTQFYDWFTSNNVEAVIESNGFKILIPVEMLFKMFL